MSQANDQAPSSPSNTPSDLEAAGRQALASGNLRRAVAILGKAVALAPQEPRLLALLASVVAKLGDLKTAESLYGKALTIDADNRQALFGLGYMFLHDGRNTQAVAMFEKLVAQDPDNQPAVSGLAFALWQVGRREQAVALYQELLANSPGNLTIHGLLTGWLFTLGREMEGDEYLNSLATQKPDDPEPLITVGTALLNAGLVGKAKFCFETAFDLDSNHPLALRGLAATYDQLGQFAKADGCNQKLLTLNPNDHRARFRIGLNQLRRGEFAEGWFNFALWRHLSSADRKPRQDLAPAWDGEALDGLTLLVIGQQETDDVLQFVRYLPQLRGQDTDLLLEVSSELVGLLEASALADRVITRQSPVPRHDLHVHLLDLPRLFNTELATIPDQVPYLSVDQTLCQDWRQRLESDPVGAPPKFRIGIAWTAGPETATSNGTTWPVASLASLADLPNVALYALEQDPEGTAQEALGGRLIDFTAEVDDLCHLAALINGLDLIITADGMVAHLAGGLGKLVWTLLPSGANWRWLLDRSDSPWYPSMRLLRQTLAGDWAPLLEHVVADATALSAAEVPVPAISKRKKPRAKAAHAHPAF